MEKEEKMKVTTVLFDLDGTLTDSGPGIISGVRYALKKDGRELPGDDVLRTFVGPPLKEQFRDFCGITDEKAAWMVETYREYYTEKGIFENSVYDGVTELLRCLKKAGLQIAMATSKPEKFAKIIADHFDFARYFDFIGGACMDGTRTDKQEVIEYVLENCHVRERDQVLMIGDRSYDITGAHRAGLQAMGVLYGYGTEEELQTAGADFIAATPEEAGRIILQNL